MCTAFYSDCDHTLMPVTKGLRLVLAYNLVRSNTTTSFETPKSIESESSSEVISAVSDWQQDENGPSKLFMSLEHKYSTKNLCYDGLKGTDTKLVNRLLSIQDSNCNSILKVYLAILKKSVMGHAYDSPSIMDQIDSVSIITDFMINTDRNDINSNFVLNVSIEKEAVFKDVENVFDKKPNSEIIHQDYIGTRTKFCIYTVTSAE